MPPFVAGKRGRSAAQMRSRLPPESEEEGQRGGKKRPKSKAATLDAGDEMESNATTAAPKKKFHTSKPGAPLTCKGCQKRSDARDWAAYTTDATSAAQAPPQVAVGEICKECV